MEIVALCNVGPFLISYLIIIRLGGIGEGGLWTRDAWPFAVKHTLELTCVEP